MTRLEPKLLTVLREGIPRAQLLSDLSAGLVVGIVALPLAIAFAIASGVKPEQGLYTAVVAGFLISALSGSRVQIGGPTGAFIVLVNEIVQRHGYDGLAVATMMAGVLLLVMGFGRLGTLIQFIPYPVTVGFTSGIALIIGTGQLRDALGLQMTRVPAEFLERVEALTVALPSWNAWAVAISVATIALMVLLPRRLPRVPGSLLALLVTTVVVQFFGLPVETIGGRFGAVPTSLPSPHIPAFDLAMLRQLTAPAVSIALLAGIESLLSAVVADGMTGRRHRSNMELVAQGVANIASPLFGGIPATGAIARTATNIKSGGRTPIAGMVHSVVLMLILVFFGRWAGLIPLPTLAGILLVVAYNMSEYQLFAKVLRSTRSDALVLLATFLLTVLVDLTAAIQVGVVLASFLFMRRMAEVTEVRTVKRLLDDEEEEGIETGLEVPDGVEVFAIAGSFFFGAVQKFKVTLSNIQRTPTVLILDMSRVMTIDATGMRALEEVMSQSRRSGTTLLLAGVHAQPLVALQRSELLDEIGEENLTEGLRAAVERARQLVAARKGVAGEPELPA